MMPPLSPAAEALHGHGALSVEVRDGEGERDPLVGVTRSRS